MTANQRRPGFRLPWSSEMDDQGGEAASGSTDQVADGADPKPDSDSGQPAVAPADPQAVAAPQPQAPAANESAAPAAEATSAPEPAPAAPAAETPGAAPVAGAAVEPAEDFMRDLVAAMRGVADEARETTIADLRARADEQVRRLETDAERRREELRTRSEKDIAEVGEWAKAEAERIRQEAEQRVAARRTQLEQQLSGETTRTEADTTALRERVAEYERELEAYHEQLLQINDPAAFAAAAKRMPKPPTLTPGTLPQRPAPAEPLTSAPAAPTRVTAAATTAPVAPDAAPDTAEPVEPVQPQSNGVPNAPTEVHPAEEEVLAARLAHLDATLPADAGTAATEPAAAAEPATTEVVVKGLGSFGAITGFRQALSGVEGIDGVALSLGQTGEFVFRATHAAGFDVGGAIAQLEGDGAKIEDRPEGGLRVTLERAR